MAFTVISTWELVDGASFDIALSQVKERRLPALRELGATSVRLVRTSDRTIAAIVDWPDAATHDAAEDAIEAVRAKVRAEDHSRMTGEMMGEVVAVA